MTVDWGHFTPWISLAGGLLIGAAAAMLVLLNGRVSFGSGQDKAAVFVAAVLLGMLVYTIRTRRTRAAA